MIDLIKKGVEKEIEILREISAFSRRIEMASPSEKAMLSEGLKALEERMRETNNSLGALLDRIVVSEKKEIKDSPRASPKAIVEIAKPGKKSSPSLEKIEAVERADFLRELTITDSVLKKIKNKQAVKEEKVAEFKKARGYLKIANKFFLGSADKLVRKGYFKALPDEIKKSNLDILFEAYVAMMLFSTFIAFILSVVLAVFLMFFNIGLSWPIISLFEGDMLIRFLNVVYLPIAIPLIVLAALYFYPSTEKKSISNRIDEELPFAVIHMSSISGSGIEPVEIFKIIAMGRDYPFLKKEIRKILNQINIYGYDLVTALNNVSKSTSNPRLAELFAGLSTTINSGGSLSEFFAKRSETLLLNYKLDKEKSIKIAETSMDIYISVVIAAPMILMLMLVMISISGIQMGFTPYELTFMTIGGVALINIVFLAYLQTKRTLY